MRIQREGDTAIIALAGELDHFSSEVLNERLQRVDSDIAVVVLDLRELGFIDGAGLRSVEHVRRRLIQHGASVEIREAPRIMYRTAEILDIEL